jgi:hypothetical protein
MATEVCGRRARLGLAGWIVIGVAAGCSENRREPATVSTEGTPAARSATVDAAPGDPKAAYDEITLRALQMDSAYTRAHMAPEVFDQARNKGEDPASAAFMEKFQKDLAFSRAVSWTPTDREDRVVIEGASVNPGVFGGSVWLFRIDMVRDGNQWRLASLPYDQRPLSAAGSPKGNGM